MKITHVTTRVLRTPADNPLVVGLPEPTDTREFVTLELGTDQGLVGLGLTFFFRRQPRDMETLAETIHGLSGKVGDLLARRRAEERIALLQSVVFHANDAVVIGFHQPGQGAALAQRRHVPRGNDLPELVRTDRHPAPF